MSKRQMHSSTMVNLICPICHSALEDVETGAQCSCCRCVFPVVGAVLCFSEQGKAAWDNGTRHQFDFYDARYATQVSAPAYKPNTMTGLHVLTFKMAQLDALISDFQLRENFQILEVGCGDGWFLRWLNNRYHVRGIGVDISPAAANLAAANDWADNEYYAVEASQLPFEAASFDLVCSLDMIEHLTHKRKRDALQEMARVLKPGGNVLLYTLHIDDKYTDFWFKRTWARLRGGERAVRERERRAYEQEGGHLRSNFTSVQAMRVLARESGLENVQILPFHAMYTNVYDLYIARFVIIPSIKLINRISRVWRARNSSATSSEASTDAPVVPWWKGIIVQFYHPIFTAIMKLFCAMDRRLIAKGHFASMFVVGRKRVR